MRASVRVSLGAEVKVERLTPRRIARRLRALFATRELRSDPENQWAPCPHGRYVTVGLDPGSSSLTADTTIVITSADPDLLAIARGFLDDTWQVYVIDGSKRCYGLSAIRHAIERVPTRRAVMLDEDTFVLDNQALRDLVLRAGELELSAVGVPDGGVISMRTHNPNALNPFFNVLDLAAIRAVWDAQACLRWEGKGSEMTSPWPPAALLKSEVPYVFDDYEPYYCFYFWLEHTGLRTGYLDARTHTDGMSTIVVDQAGRPLVIHSWHGRKFEKPTIRERILDVAAYARGEEDRLGRWRGRDWSGF